MKLYGPRFFRFALPIQQYKVGTPQLMGRLRCGGVKCGYPHVFKDMPCVGREDQIPCRERESPEGGPSASSGVIKAIAGLRLYLF